MAYNDATFQDKDWDSLKTIRDSKKTDQYDKAGKLAHHRHPSAFALRHRGCINLILNF